MEDFNPRYREVATVRGAFIVLMMQVFQSTLPRGSDQDLRDDINDANNFNPRYREVATLQKQPSMQITTYFNPRYREVATATAATEKAAQAISIHATAR